MLGVASIRRFEIRSYHFRHFFHDPWYGDVDSLLHYALLSTLLWDQSHNFFRNVLNRHLRLDIWSQPRKIIVLACQCTGPMGNPLFSVPSESQAPVVMTDTSVVLSM